MRAPLLAVLLAAALCWPAQAEPSAELRRQHEEMLYAVTMVRTAGGSGSGIVIYSQERDGEWASYILTNHHVISSAIRRQKICCDEDGEQHEVERRSPVEVLWFEYNDLSRPIGNRGKRAEIEAFDQLADLALLRLQDRENPVAPVALMHDPADPLYMFEPVWAVGAGLGEPPFATAGLLSRVEKEIDGYPYITASAPIIYGNSGGALFHLSSAGRYELIGVTSRGRAAGWQLVEHINFSISMETVSEFLRANCHGLIVGDEVEREECREGEGE